MSNSHADRREASVDRNPATDATQSESDIDETDFNEATRNRLLTFMFELAAQHVRKLYHLETDDLAHEIGLNAFEEMRRQPSSREKVRKSLCSGGDDWKRVAHMCVIHARAKNIKRVLADRQRRSSAAIEDCQLPAPTREQAAIVTDLSDCIARLDIDRQNVLHLRFKLGLTFQQIAERLNWSKTRVYACYATALIQLRRSLKGRE